ncbi:MAG: N-acetyltransferase family protein [Desulfovibrionaceae bacterium]
MDYRIRDARPEDLPGIRTAHREAVLGLAREEYSREQLTAWAAAMRPEAIWRALADPELTMLVALVDAVVAGFICLPPGRSGPCMSTRPMPGKDPAAGS